MSYQFDGLHQQLDSIDRYQLNPTLFELNVLLELVELINKEGSTCLKNKMGPVKDLINSVYKKLAYANLETTKLLLGLDELEDCNKRHALGDFLGSSLYEKLDKICDSNFDLIIPFANQIIQSLVPQNKCTMYQEGNLDAATLEKLYISDSATVIFSGKAKTNDRQYSLSRFLNDDLKKLLVFSFDGDWNSIEKFCIQALTKQIQSSKYGDTSDAKEKDQGCS
jgi:hypothetical protein